MSFVGGEMSESKCKAWQGRDRLESTNVGTGGSAVVIPNPVSRVSDMSGGIINKLPPLSRHIVGL